MIRYIKDLLGLFFPSLCLACGKALFDHEKFICNLCWLSLPKTHFHKDPENPVSQAFWGRVWLEQAVACFYYTRGNRVQRLIHKIKYKGEQELGTYLGERYGAELKQSGIFSRADALIPVPLHPKKLKKRGFNQSEAIAKGLAASLGIEVLTGHLYRQKASETQTRKTRYNRWKNVENIFAVRKIEELRDRHVIVVDDVITTGSTLEACIRALQQVPGIKVSVVAMAYSSR